MGNFGEQYCALCYSAICNENLKKIENVTKDILEVILLKLNLVDNGKQVMCEACSQKVIEAFKFKSMCLYTDNTIIPYVGDETGCSVDLRKIYVKEKGIEPLLELFDQRKICRLCMQLIRDEFVSECDVNVDMIQSYIPEINFSVVEDPTVCRQCFISLDTHSSFIRKCLEEEQKVKPSLPSSIKIEEIEIKSESNENEQELSQIGSTVGKSENEKVSVKIENIEVETEENNESDTSNCEEEHKDIFEDDNKCKPKRHMVAHKKSVTEKIYKCEKCDYTSPLKKNFTSHQQRHKDLSKIKIHNCDICSYKTNNKSSLTRHQLHHKNPSEINMFKCIYCKYESKVKQGLRTHFISHHGDNLINPKENSKVTKLLNLKNPLNVKVHKCDKCSYKTMRETNFVIHQSKSHEKMFLKCEECDYKTMSKFCFEMHKLIHKDPSEVEMYKCHNCNYESKYKTHIKRHQLIHLNPEQVQMHKCIYCSYESKHKEALKSHLVINHRDLMLDPNENLKVMRIFKLQKPLPINAYKCDECTYETIYKLSFLDHQLTHKNRSEVQMYKCDTCDWETKHKNRLTRHKLEHTRSHEVPTYECDICGIVTKARSSIVRHQRKHKNASGVQMYKCHNCDYETKFRSDIIQHQLLHKNPSRMFMYKCDICDFETKYKNRFGKHKLLHKNPSEVRMYNCEICGYAAKRKSNLNSHQLTHKNASKV